MFSFCANSLVVIVGADWISNKIIFWMSDSSFTPSFTPSNNGQRRKVDLTPLLVYPAFAELRDKSNFIQFGLDQTIFWVNGADIAPEYLFEHEVEA